MILPNRLSVIISKGGANSLSWLMFFLSRLPLPEAVIWDQLIDATVHTEEEIEDAQRRLRDAGSTPGAEAYSPGSWTPLDDVIDLTTEADAEHYDPATPTPPSPQPNAEKCRTPSPQPSTSTPTNESGYETSAAPSPNPTYPPTPRAPVITIDDQDNDEEYACVRQRKDPPCIYSDFMTLVVAAFSALRTDLEEINSPAAVTALDAISTLIIKTVDDSLLKEQEQRNKTRRILRAKRQFYISKRIGLIHSLIRSVAMKDITIPEIHNRLVQLCIKAEIVDLTSEKMMST